MLCCAVLCCAVLCCAVLCCAVLCCAVWCTVFITLHGILSVATVHPFASRLLTLYLSLYLPLLSSLSSLTSSLPPSLLPSLSSLSSLTPFHPLTLTSLSRKFLIIIFPRSSICSLLLLPFSYPSLPLPSCQFDIYIKQTLSAISGRRPTDSMMEAVRKLSDDPLNAVVSAGTLTCRLYLAFGQLLSFYLSFSIFVTFYFHFTTYPLYYYTTVLPY